MLHTRTQALIKKRAMADSASKFWLFVAIEVDSEQEAALKACFADGKLKALSCAAWTQASSSVIPTYHIFIGINAARCVI